MPGRCALGSAKGGDVHDPHLEEHERGLLAAEYAAGQHAEPQGVRGRPGARGLLPEPTEEDDGEGEAGDEPQGG